MEVRGKKKGIRGDHGTFLKRKVLNYHVNWKFYIVKTDSPFMQNENEKLTSELHQAIDQTTALHEKIMLVSRLFGIVRDDM